SNYTHEIAPVEEGDLRLTVKIGVRGWTPGPRSRRGKAGHRGETHNRAIRQEADSNSRLGGLGPSRSRVSGEGSCCIRLVARRHYCKSGWTVGWRCGFDHSVLIGLVI